MSPYLVIAIVVAAVIVAVFVLLLIMSKPNRKRGGLEKYLNTKYAHRGLHSDTVAENSLTAFRLAAEAGYGIELDVHTAKCGTAVVFHDGTLKRMTGVDEKLCDKTAEELGQMKLLDTDDCIPTFKEVLELIDGRVPLLVELKQNPGESGVAEAAYELLKDYKGDFIVESFNPITLRDFARLMPEVRRGILSTNYLKYKKHTGVQFRLAQALLFNFMCKPDFVAYNHEDGKYLPLRAHKAVFKTPTVAWTVRSADEEKAAYGNKFDTVIFENYIPEKTK